MKVEFEGVVRDIVNVWVRGKLGCYKWYDGLREVIVLRIDMWFDLG